MSYHRKRGRPAQQGPVVAPPKQIDLYFSASPTISRFIVGNAFIRGVRGPVGSGKSSGCVMEIMKHALSMPRNKRGLRCSKWAIVRQTYRELMDTTVATWLEWFPEETFGPFSKQDMVHDIQVADLRLTVMFRAAERPDEVKKFKSLDITGFWINEAGEVAYEVLDMLETRVGRYPKKNSIAEENWEYPGEKPFWSGGIMDTNPPDEESWWYFLAEEVSPILAAAKRWEGTDLERLQMLRGEFEKRRFDRREYEGLVASVDTMIQKATLTRGSPVRDPGVLAANCRKAFEVFTTKYEFFAQPSGLSDEAENIAHLPEGYYERLCIGKSQEWINVMVKGNYGMSMAGKPVFPEYNDAFHYDPTLTEAMFGVKIIRGWDFGRTPCCVFAQVDPEGRLMIFDEMTSDDTDIDEFGDRVKKYCAQMYAKRTFVDYCDPSGFFKGDKSDLSCAQILSAKGIEVEGGVQDVTIRLNSVKRCLRGAIRGKAEFRIGPKAKVTRKGLQGKYQYKRKNVVGNQYEDTPEKRHPVSDVQDALQYICTMLYANDLLDPAVQGGEEEQEWGFVSGFQSTGGASATTGY